MRSIYPTTPYPIGPINLHMFSSYRPISTNFLLRLRIHFIFRRQCPLPFLLNFHELINSVTIVRHMTYVLNVGLHSTYNDLQILRSLKVIDYMKINFVNMKKMEKRIAKLSRPYCSPILPDSGDTETLPKFQQDHPNRHIGDRQLIYA